MPISQEQDRKLSIYLQKAQEGDKQAYNQLLREVSDLVRGFVERRIGRGPDSEDVLQNILISIHNARHTYDSARPFSRWMFAIARYRVCDHWRKAGRRLETACDEETEATWKERVPAELDGSVADRLAKSLGRLPEKQALVINLLKMKGLSIREAARELKMTETAIKVTAHRAYEALRREFEVETDGYA